MRKLTEEDMKNPFWRLVFKSRYWRFYIKTFFGKVIYATANDEKSGKKLFFIIRVRRGKAIWSRHLVVESVLEDRGIPNTQYDKIFEKWN